MNFPDVMLDTETAGLGPTAAIMSIGAVSFDMRELVLGEHFYATIDLESTVRHGATIEPGTFVWWMKQSDAARQAILRNASPDLYFVLSDFSEWLHSKCAAKNGVKLWANSPAFDCVKLEVHYANVGLQKPWEFWNERCYRTVRGLYPNVEADARDGTFHNALDDAIFQAKHLMKIRRTLRGAS